MANQRDKELIAEVYCAIIQDKSGSSQLSKNDKGETPHETALREAREVVLGTTGVGNG